MYTIKIKDFLTKTFNYIFLFLFAFIFISVIFANNNSTFSYKILPSIIAFLIILSLLFCIPFLLSKYDKPRNYLKNNSSNVIFISMIILMIIQLYMVYALTTPIGWDSGIVVSGAVQKDLNEGTYFYSYFSVYPNNLFLMFLFRIISNLIGSTGLWVKLNALSIVAVDTSLILTFYIINKIKDLKSAYLCFYLSALTFGIFAWIIVPYSDILAMPFTISTYALYLKLFDSKHNSTSKSIIYSLIIGAFLFIGYLIKPTVVIVFIGIVLCKLIFSLNHASTFNLKNIIKKVIPSILIIATILVSNSIWTQYIYNQNIITINKDLKTPMSHFFMLGLSSHDGMYGAWNAEDVNLTLTYNTKEEKIQANKKVIKERLQNYGILGYSNFLLNKTRWITSEGNFFFGGEGNFAKFEITDNSPLIRNLVYTNGKYNKVYQYFLQGIWISVIFLILISSISMSRNKHINDFHNFTFSMIIFGIILFILLFEGRSRYLILYLPFFTMYASNGLNNILSLVSKKK